MYWFPNRPLLMTQEYLDEVETLAKKFPIWAEPKLKGDRLVLIRAASGKWRFFNRHKKELMYRPPEGMIQELNSIRDISYGEAQLDGELLHFHTKEIKNKLVLYDVYVLGGEQVRETLRWRHQWLDSMVPCREPFAWTNSKKYISVIPTYAENFREKFDTLTKRPEVEGLVFKSAYGLIEFDTISSPDVPWQIKVRRSEKNHKMFERLG